MKHKDLEGRGSFKSIFINKTLRSPLYPYLGRPSPVLYIDSLRKKVDFEHTVSDQGKKRLDNTTCIQGDALQSIHFCFCTKPAIFLQKENGSYFFSLGSSKLIIIGYTYSFYCQYFFFNVSRTAINCQWVFLTKYPSKIA